MQIKQAKLITKLTGKKTHKKLIVQDLTLEYKMIMKSL